MATLARHRAIKHVFEDYRLTDQEDRRTEARKALLGRSRHTGDVMYKANEVRILDPPCDTMDDSFYCDNWGHCHTILDSREQYSGNCLGKTAYLSHSCDEWVIGGPEQVQQLINDLQAILRTWEK